MVILPQNDLQTAPKSSLMLVLKTRKLLINHPEQRRWRQNINLLEAKQNMKFKKQNTPPIGMRCEASWTINNKRHCCQRLIPHNASSHPHWQRRVCKECKLQYENHVLLTIVSLMKQTHPRLKDYIHNTYNRLRKGRRVSMNKGVCCKTSACKC